MFCNVHCLVCAGDERFQIFSILVFGGNANADCDTDFLIRNSYRYFCDGIPRPFGDLQGRWQVGLWQNNDQFFATISADKIYFANGIFAALRKLLKNIIPYLMSIVIIDLLKIIQIKHHA